MRDAAAVTLGDVSMAFGESMISEGGTVESPGCLVEHAVSGLMVDVRRQVVALLGRRFGRKDVGGPIGGSKAAPEETHKRRRMLHAA